MNESIQNLAGRIALITGANSGIGKASALQLAAAGAKVMLAGRNKEATNAVVEEILVAGGVAASCHYDAMSSSDADTAVAATMNEFGRLDICVANAGGTVGGSAPLTEMTDEMWRGTMELNADAVFFLFRSAAREMKRTGTGGSLIAISSVASIRAVPSAHYAAAKGAVNALTINLSVQLGPSGIRVNAILPGPIETPPLKAFLSTDEQRQTVTKRIPLGMIGQPEQVAELVCFLASDRSDMINGQMVAIDGGMSNT